MTEVTQLEHERFEAPPDGEEYHFCVVCPRAQQVYLVGEFNGWSTTATPMVRTEENVWQISLRLPRDPDHAAASPPGANRLAHERRFSYFVIDEQFRTGRAPFGSTYLLPGTWAAVVRLPAEN